MLNLWWESMAGPSNFMRNALEALNESSYVILMDKDAPEREDMRRIMDQRIHDMTPERIVDFINKKELADMTPAEYILENYGDTTVKNGYRASRGETVQKYIRQSKVLINRILWLYDLTEQQEEAWCKFAKDYGFENARNGQFIIETNHNSSNGMEHVIDYVENITHYDYQMYNIMLCSQLQMNSQKKQYVANLASMIFKNRIDLSREYVERAMNMDKSDRYIYLIKEIIRENGVEDPELDRNIWKAQLQIIFSMIEEERDKFTTKYYSEIRYSLGCQYADKKGYPTNILQYNEQVTDPKDAELGILYRMTQLNIFGSNGTRMLDIQDKGDMERLKLIWTMRNELAHNNYCSDDEISEFLDFYPYFI